MQLAEIIEAFVADHNRTDEVTKNEESGYSQLATDININNQTFDMFIRGDDTACSLSFFLNAPFRVIEGKLIDACMLFNYLNDSYMYRGRITVNDNGVIRYKEIIDTENIEPCVAMINNMLISGIQLFRNNMAAIAAVALTNRTYESIREEYDKKDALRLARDHAPENNEEASTEKPEEN